MNTLLGHLGWRDYIQLQFFVYVKLMQEFFSYFTSDTTGEYHNRSCYILFLLGDLTHKMNLARFSEFLQLPPSGTTNFVHKDYGRSEFLRKVTCHSQLYVSHSSKATSMCNPALRYLQHLTTNIIFPQFDSQGVPRMGELFILSVALHRIHPHTVFHIITQIEEQAKSRTLVITAEGIVTTLAHDLGLGNLFPLCPSFVTVPALTWKHVCIWRFSLWWATRSGSTITVMPSFPCPILLTPPSSMKPIGVMTMTLMVRVVLRTPTLVCALEMRTPCQIPQLHVVRDHSSFMWVLLPMRSGPPTPPAQRRFPSVSSYLTNLLGFT